jgi:hypothetical protein
MRPFEAGVAAGAGKLFWVFLALSLLSKLFQASGHSLPDFSVFFKTVGLNPMNASGFGAFALLYLCARPSRRGLAVTAAVGLLLELYYHVAVWPNASLTYRLLIAGPGLAAAALAALLLQAGFDKVPVARQRARSMLSVGLVLLMYPAFAGLLLGTLSRLTPQVYDASAYMLEAGLGFFPSQQAALFLKSHPELDPFFIGVYSRLPLVVFGGFALNLLYDRRCYSNLFLAALAGGVISFAIYPMLPMIGIDLFVGVPPYPDGALPLHIAVKPVPAPADFPRTCFPSMHACWSLLPFLALRRISRPVAVLFGVCAVGTMVSALSHQVGHFLLDIFIAFPFALAMQAIATIPVEGNAVWRKRCVLFGLGSTIGVAALVRTLASALSPYAALFWLLLAALVTISLLLEERLARASLAPTILENG